MFNQLRVGILAAACVFVVASAVPADAQRGHGSGGGGGSHPGATAAPRSSQGPGPSGGGHPGAGPGSGGGGHPSQGSRPGGGSGPGYRPGGGPGYRPGYGHGGYPGYGYRGYYPWYGYGGYYPYSGFYWGLGAYSWPYYYGYRGYPGYYGNDYGYGYGYDGGYGYGDGPGGAGLKVVVQPKDAEVYIDGRLAGIVDQFDGMFDSLSLEAGQHEVIIFRDGFRSIHQQLYLNPGKTYRIKAAMVPLAPGEPNESRPQQAAPPSMWPDPQARVAPQYPGYAPRSQQPVRRVPNSQVPNSQAPVSQAPESYPPLDSDARFGRVAVHVQPGDAEVLIDGVSWRPQEGADRLVVHLAPGTHRVEIRKEGFEPFVSAVEIKRGATAELNVSLMRF